MHVHILGSGAANDPTLPNSSVVVSCGGTRIMIDCGYSVAREAIAAYRDPDAIDALVFTHHHPDHSFGFVSTIGAWSDAGRRKPMAIATTEWGWRQLETLMRIGFGADWKPSFPCLWHTVPEPLMVGPAHLSFAPTQHGVPNHAIRIETDEEVFAYSGDGQPTPQSLDLFTGADLLMHECNTLEPDPDQPGHCWLAACVEILQTRSIGRMLLYHVSEPEKSMVAAAVKTILHLEIAETGASIQLEKEERKRAQTL
mgnify:CR=1 FL=1